MQVGYGFGQNSDSIPLSWVLLDTCSTASVFFDIALVNNLVVCSDEEVLLIHTNRGTQTFDLKSKMKMFPIEVHFNSESMANILSLKDVVSMRGACITMDTFEERAITLRYEGNVYKFKEHKGGL